MKTVTIIKALGNKVGLLNARNFHNKIKNQITNDIMKTLLLSLLTSLDPCRLQFVMDRAKLTLDAIPPKINTQGDCPDTAEIKKEICKEIEKGVWESIEDVMKEVTE